MRDCSYYEEQISAYLDQALSQEETEMLLAHLEACPACRTLLEDLTTLSHAMPLLDAVPPSSFAADVVQAVKQQRRQRRRCWRNIGSVAALFLVVLLGAGSVLLRQSSADTTEELAGAGQPSEENEAWSAGSVEATDEGGLKGTPGFCLSSSLMGLEDRVAAAETTETQQYSARVIVQGLGVQKELPRWELDGFLAQLEEEGVRYLCETEGEEIDPDAGYCLISYQAVLPES